MGLALFVVWRNKGSAGSSTKRLALSVFTVQLALNVLWSVLFFGLRSPSLAFVDIVILWAAITANILTFTKISRWAGVLLIPYIVWTTIALTLNLQIWILNP
jgi:translocator protein